MKIRFTATGKVVARPRVRRSGLFSATAPMPRRRLRATNRARYRAEIAKQKSLRLKLVRRLSCGRFRVVKRFTPPASGRFRVRLAGPPSSQAAAYRLQTRVRKFTTNPKLFPTFTLPRYIDLAQ